MGKNFVERGNPETGLFYRLQAADLFQFKGDRQGRAQVIDAIRQVKHVS
jgi:hypothetical protein